METLSPLSAIARGALIGRFAAILWIVNGAMGLFGLLDRRTQRPRHGA